MLKEGDIVEVCNVATPMKVQTSKIYHFPPLSILNLSKLGEQQVKVKEKMKQQKLFSKHPILSLQGKK